MMYYLLLLLTVLGSGFLPNLSFAAGSGATSCGVVKISKGEVTFNPRARSAKNKKTGGQKIVAGTKISTGPEAMAMIELPGINTLTVESGTKLQITKCKFNKKKLSTVIEIRLDKGEMSAQAITKSHRASVSFIVKTGPAIVETTQAEFSLVHDDLTRKTEVQVEKGMVQLSARKKTEKSGTLEISSHETGYVYIGQDPEKKSAAK